MEVPSKQTFDKYVQMGLLKSASSNGKTVYCYNEFCQFSQLWNSITRQARGIVFSDDGELLQRCVPKFFNLGEREGIADFETMDKSMQENFLVEEKLDGCLIKVSRVDDELLITSKCSFDNEYVDTAKKVIESNYPSIDNFVHGLTYHFELLTEQTLGETVVDYGEEPRLVLWAIVNNRTGAELDIYDSSLPFERPKLYPNSIVENVNSLNDDGEVHEGVVLVYGNGHTRLKIKTLQYLTLFRAKKNLNSTKVWEALSRGQELTHADVPEEFWDWLDNTNFELKNEFSKAKASILVWHFKTNQMDDKSLALSKDIPSEVKSSLFAVRKGDEQAIDTIIWKKIKPAKEPAKARRENHA